MYVNKIQNLEKRTPTGYDVAYYLGPGSVDSSTAATSNPTAATSNPRSPAALLSASPGIPRAILGMAHGRSPWSISVRIQMSVLFVARAGRISCYILQGPKWAFIYVLGALGCDIRCHQAMASEGSVGSA